MKWPLSKMYFTSSFLQTGAAKRDVHVASARDCRRKSFYWLLLKSAYVLVNTNAKWQEQCDFLFSNKGLCLSHFIPQLFYLFNDSAREIIPVKIVNDVLIARKRSKVLNFISSIKFQYKLGTIVLWSGSFLFYQLQKFQDNDISIRIHGGGKLESLNCFAIDLRRR